MKQTIISFLGLFLASGMMAQENKFDPAAIMILDRMSDVIGDMTSCSFKTSVAHDVADPDFGMVKQFVQSEVYLVGPDKMLVNYWGPHGHRQCWYDGKQFAIYDFEEKNYGMVPAPNNIIATIDSIHEHFGFDFPAADFLYPAFTDDLLESCDRIAFNGRAEINGHECFQVIAKNATTTSQIWISNDAFNLPVRYVITYDSKPGHPQYDCTFTDWQVNPDLPNAMFNFVPPPGTHEVRLMSTDQK